MPNKEKDFILLNTFLSNVIERQRNRNIGLGGGEAESWKKKKRWCLNMVHVLDNY